MNRQQQVNLMQRVYRRVQFLSKSETINLNQAQAKIDKNSYLNVAQINQMESICRRYSI